MGQVGLPLWRDLQNNRYFDSFVIADNRSGWLTNAERLTADILDGNRSVKKVILL
jgi:hypothetical protein